MPGGRFNAGGQEQNIRTVGASDTVSGLSDMRVDLSSGKSVRLGDLGTVTDTWSEPRARARFNNSEVVGFNIERTRGTSEVKVAAGVRERIAALQKANPHIQINEVASSVVDVQRSYDTSLEALVIGAALAVVVVFLFLRDWRATFVSAVAMPMSLLPTFFVLHALNQSFNVVTLLALSLTVGILVDDAIVEIENIVRHMREGKKAYPAAIEAADEIGLAVVATTATLIAVFAPTGFMPGIVGQFFKSFAIASCVSVFFSLVVARTLTPLMGAYLLRLDKKHDHDEPFWMPFYLTLLRFSLRHRALIVICSIIFFVGSAVLVATIPQDNIPASDQSMSIMSLSYPPGTTLNETDATVEKITNDLRKRPEVKSVYAVTNMQNATLTVNLVPIKERKLSQAKFEQDFSKTLKTYPGVRASFGQQGGGGTGVAYILVGEDGDLLSRTAVRLQQEMAGLKELTNVSSQDNLTQPEIEITPKSDEAARMGVSTTSISSAARVATMGDIDQILAKFNDGDRQVPIRVLLKQQARYDVNNLSNLMVPTATGTSVPLTAVADVSFGAGPIAIHRLDRTRSATVSADLNGVPNGVADKAIQDLPVMKDIKAGKIPGVRIAVNPNTEDFIEMVPNFFAAIGTGVGLMFMVLVLLFGSFMRPLVIILSLPLCYGGAFVALILCHMTISMPSLIGLIMLTGIAAKNAILLVEYAMVAQKGGMPRFDALIESARKRARPIVMTTVAMGAGMLPVAIGNDSFRQPMAVAVIGGLITSTLLSLLFVPVLYTIFDRFSNWLGKIFHIEAQGKDEAEPHNAE